jgi:hypothetical protein
MRIEMDKVIIASGVGTAVERGAGGVVRSEFSHVWLEGDYVYVVPKVARAGQGTRMYHASVCEMYPTAGQKDLPAPVVHEEPKLAAVGGKK